VALLGLRWTDIQASRRQDASYKHIWQSFRSAEHVADGRHDTAEWRSHAPAVYAFVAIRVPVDAIRPALDEVRRALTPVPFVRQHPDHFLHITLQELGFVVESPQAPDELDQVRLNEIVSQLPAALSGAPAFDVRLGGANAFRDAVFLDVHDRGHCGRLHTRLRELAGVLSVPKFAYLPHATIAHFTAEKPTGDLPQLIGRWRDRRFGSFQVTTIEVVTMDVRLTYPRLSSYAIHELL
jgi:2'-5' RNA ligase